MNSTDEAMLSAYQARRQELAVLEETVLRRQAEAHGIYDRAIATIEFDRARIMRKIDAAFSSVCTLAIIGENKSDFAD